MGVGDLETVIIQAVGASYWQAVGTCQNGVDALSLCCW